MGQCQYSRRKTPVPPREYWSFPAGVLALPYRLCADTISLSCGCRAGREAFHAEEELAERGGVGEVEAVGDLLDAEARRAQQEGDLHHEHLVNVVDDNVASFSINLNRKTIITN